MADGEVRAQDLAQETASTLSGNEQFVMFDSTAGKRADIDDVATYVAGDKTTLKTTNKTSPVAAINENFDAIADVKEDLTSLSSVDFIEFTNGGYITTNGAVGSTVSLTPSSNGAFRYAIVDCSEGDRFTLNGTGWTTGRLWCFIDEDNKLLKASDASVTVADFILEAPANSAKAIFNMWISSAGSCYKGEPLPTQSVLDNALGYSKIMWTEGAVVATNGNDGSVVNMMPSANGYFEYAIVNCTEGDIFVLNGTGWTTGRLFCFVDSENKILYKSETNVVADNLELVAPANSAKAIFNMWISSAGISYKGLPLDLYKKDTNELINDNDNHYSGLFSIVSGIMQTTRVIATNTKRATTNIIHLVHPFTLSINSGWQLLYLVGGVAGPLVDKGWTIVNGGSHHFTLSDGECFAFVLAKTSLTDIDASTAFVDSGFRLIMDGTNDDIFDNDIGNIKSALATANMKPVYIVDINGSGDYTSILSALKSTADYSKLIIKNGTYNMQAEYENYYGSDYFTNYAGYDLSDIYSRGYFVGSGRELDFEAGAKISFRYEGNNNNVKQFFSVLNTGTDATIKGAYIYYKNLRYAIHDDYALNNAGTNIFENIIIQGIPSSITGIHWGGGCGKKNKYILNNIIFLDDEMPSNYGDIYYHNNEVSGAVNRITMNNCYGERGCSFLWMGQSQEISYVIVSGCKYSSISIRAQSADAPYENMKLIEFNNTETA